MKYLHKTLKMQTVHTALYTKRKKTCIKLYLSMKNSTFMHVFLCFAYPVRKHMKNLHKSIDYHIQNYCWLDFLLKPYGIRPVNTKTIFA